MTHGDAGKLRCWSCGHPVGPDAEGCDDCGAMLLVLCEECGSTQSAFARECGNCGATLDPRSYQPPRRARRVLLIVTPLILAAGLAAFLIARSNADSPYQMLEDAVQDFESGRFQAASVKLRMYNQRWPGDADALYNLAASLFSMGQKDEAAEFARQSLDASPDQPEPHLLLAACAYEDGLPHAARDHAVKILERPASLLKAAVRARAHLILGKAYAHPGNLDMRRAAVHLQAAVDSGLVDDPEAWVLLAEIDMARRAAGVAGPSEAKAEIALTRANEVATRLSQAAPDDLGLMFLRARIHFARGEAEDATKWLIPVLDEKPTPVHRVFQARLHAKRGQSADAHIALERALRSEEVMAADYLAVSDAYREMGEAARAEEVLTAARTRFPQDLGVVLRAVDRLLNQGRFEEANDLAVQGLDESPGHDLLTVARADAIARQPGRLLQAEKLLREHEGGTNSMPSLRLADYLLDTPADAPDCEARIREAEDRIDAADAESVEIHSLYRQFLRGKIALRRGRLDEAVTILSQVALRSPTDVSTRRLLAHTFGRRHEFEMEGRELGAVMSLVGSSPDLRAARAEAWFRAGFRKLALSDLNAVLAVRPDHPRALLLLAEAQLEEDRGQPDRALKTLARLRDLPGSGIEAHLRIGSLLAEQGNLDGAEQAVLEGRERARTTGERLEATDTLARIRAARTDRPGSDESRQVWREFIDSNPEVIAGPLRYAVALLDARDPTEARHQVDRVLESHPGNIAALRLRFECCLTAEKPEARDIDGARAAAARVKKLDPEGSTALYLEGRLALIDGRKDDAARILAAAGDRNPADSRIAYHEALALAEVTDRPGAAAALTRALASEPGLRSARDLLARVNITWARELLAADRQKEAIDLLTRSLEESPGSIPVRALLAKALYYAGISVRASLLPEARTRCEELLDEFDEQGGAADRKLHASARLLHAAVLMAERKWEDAAAAFTRHLHLDPKSVISLRRRGICYMRAGRFDEAVLSLKSAYSLAPDDFPLLVDLLNACGAAGREAEAARLVGARLEKHPQDSAARTLLGRILEHRGEKGPAEDFYREAVRIDPEHLPAADWLADLLLADGREADAEQFTRALLATTGRKNDVRVLLGHVLLYSDPRNQEAETLLRQAVEEGTRDRELWLRGLNLWIGVLLRTNRAAEAAALEVTLGDWIRTNREALLISPVTGPTAYAWFLLGQAHIRSGSDPRAEFCYRRALVIVPSYAEAVNNLAGLLGREAMKRPEPRRSDMLAEAERLASKAAELKPDRPEPQDTWAEILLRSGRAKDALARTDNALDLARKGGDSMASLVPHLLLRRAAAKLALSDRVGARRALEKALALDPALSQDPLATNLASRLR